MTPGSRRRLGDDAADDLVGARGQHAVAIAVLEDEAAVIARQGGRFLETHGFDLLSRQHPGAGDALAEIDQRLRRHTFRPGVHHQSDGHGTGGHAQDLTRFDALPIVVAALVGEVRRQDLRHRRGQERDAAGSPMNGRSGAIHDTHLNLALIPAVNEGTLLEADVNDLDAALRDRVELGPGGR